MKIKDLPRVERPREKLEKYGPEKLTNTEPSEEDIVITKKLREAGKILDIEILDHVIVSKSEYLSFKEKRLI